MKKAVLLAFVLVLLFTTVFLISHTELKAEVEYNLRIRVVDVAGNQVTNVKVQLIYEKEGYLTYFPEKKVSEKGILDLTVAEGNYDIRLYYDGNYIECSQKRFEVTEDTEILITAYLLTMTQPSIDGFVVIDWIPTVTDMYDVMNTSVEVMNYYNTSKDVTIDVWIQDYHSRRVSEASINTTLPSIAAAALNRTYQFVLSPPSKGWVNGGYLLNAKIYDEEVVYREQSNIFNIRDRTGVPFWMQWWFWTIVIVVIIVVVLAVYMLVKKGKPPIPTVSSIPSEGIT